MEMINVVHIFFLFKISVHPPALLDHLNTRKLSPHFFIFVFFCFDFGIFQFFQKKNLEIFSKNFGWMYNLQGLEGRSTQS